LEFTIINLGQYIPLF